MKPRSCVFCFFSPLNSKLLAASKQSKIHEKIEGKQQEKLPAAESSAYNLYDGGLKLHAKICNLKWSRNFWDSFRLHRNNLITDEKAPPRWAFGRWKRIK